MIPDFVVASDVLEQTHPARLAQVCSDPAQHGVVASYHEKRAAELQPDYMEVSRAHEIAAGMHRMASVSATDADSLAARTASAHAVEVELAETGAVLASRVDVAICGDVAGHEFHGNQHTGGGITDMHAAKQEAYEASRKAYDAGSMAAHESAASAHSRVAGAMLKRGGLDAAHEAHTHEVHAIEHRAEALRIARDAPGAHHEALVQRTLRMQHSKI